MQKWIAKTRIRSVSNRKNAGFHAIINRLRITVKFMDTESPEACERIVESRVRFIPPPQEHWNEAEIEVVVALGRPQGDYPGTCMVFLDGYRKPVNIHGADKFQALCLAMKFLRDTMQHLQNLGWRFNRRILDDDFTQKDTNEPAQDEEEEEGEEDEEMLQFSLHHFFGGL